PVEQRALAPALDVLEEQHALRADAAHERERAAVRRDLRPHRAARAADPGLRAPGLAVQPLDRVDPRVRVAVVLEPAAGRDVLAVVEVAAVGRERGLARVLLPVAPLGELEPAAA